MSILNVFFPTFIALTGTNAQIIRNVYCAGVLTGYIESYETVYYKVISDYSARSIEFNSCYSTFDTYLQVLTESYVVIYQWYDIYIRIY